MAIVEMLMIMSLVMIMMIKMVMIIPKTPLMARSEELRCTNSDQGRAASREILVSGQIDNIEDTFCINNNNLISSNYQ